MRSITLPQALLAVGVIGLTIVLTQGWYTVAVIKVAYSESATTWWVHGATLAQAVAVALPIGVIGAALGRQDAGKSMPLRFTQLLAIVGLFGLTLVSIHASSFFLSLEPFATPHDYPSPGGWRFATETTAGLVAQGVAFAIPLGVLVTAWTRRDRSQDHAGEAVTLVRFITAFALLGLMYVGASVPGATNDVFFFSGQLRFNLPLVASTVAVMVCGGLLLAVVVGLGWKQLRTPFASAGSPWLLGAVAVLALGAFLAAGNGGMLQVETGQLLVPLVIILALFWANSLPWRSDGTAPDPLQPARVLAGVGLAGLTLASSAALLASDILPQLGWDANVTVPAYTMTGIAAALNVVLLAIGVRRLRTAVSTGAKLLPQAHARHVTFITAARARQGVSQLGFTVTLLFTAAVIAFLWVIVESPGPGPNIAVPIVLLLIALAIPLVAMQTGGSAFGRSRVGSVVPDPSSGLSFSGLLASTGLLGLVVVAAVSPIMGLHISVGIWVADGRWTTMTILQAVAFLAPLGVIVAGRIVARRVARFPDADAITLPRLALALALFGPSLVASGIAILPAVFSTTDPGMTDLGSELGTMIHVAAGAAVLIVGMVVLLGGGSRLAAFVGSAPLPVVVVVLALGVVTVLASYGGGDMLSIVLVALAIVALLWFRSDANTSPEEASVIGIWRRATVPLLGLAILVPSTPALAGTIALEPTHGISIVTMLVLALAYAINVWPLVRALLQLRHEPSERVSGPAPQTPA